MMRRILIVVAAFFLTGHVAAEVYPSKSIRMLIPAAPGGGVDSLGRVLATKLSVSLGKPVVPENRPGAGTMLASENLSTSPPDGYTMLIITGSHAVNAAVRNNMPYDPIKDFTFVSLAASAPDLLVVNAESPYQSLGELIAAAKKNPGKLTFGSAGAGSASQMDAELLKNMAGIDMLHIPYRGGMPAVTALIGNEINLMFLAAVGLAPQIKAGKLRALAVTGQKRTPLFPDVPTMAEAGLPGYSSEIWYGLVVPAKTPPSVVALLNRHTNEALRDPIVREKLMNAGLDPEGTTPDAFTKLVKDDIARWKKVVEKSPQLRVTD